MSRIALVDDDRNILKSVSMTLEAEGFEVETYNDGQTALVRLAAFVHLFLSGHLREGPSVEHLLRKNPLLRNLPSNRLDKHPVSLRLSRIE